MLKITLEIFPLCSSLRIINIIMFYLIGTINKVEYSLSYTNGNLFGDSEAIQKAEKENEKEHGNLGLIPESVNSNYLANEFAAYNLIKNYVFDEVTSSKNNWNLKKDVVY